MSENVAWRSDRDGALGTGKVQIAALSLGAHTISAVVTDTGGPLSHGSIVAREYGIPAVLGTGSATRRLSDGDLVAVDGDAGTVRWDEPEGAPTLREARAPSGE